MIMHRIGKLGSLHIGGGEHAGGGVHAGGGGLSGSGGHSGVEGVSGSGSGSVQPPSTAHNSISLRILIKLLLKIAFLQRLAI